MEGSSMRKNYFRFAILYPILSATTAFSANSFGAVTVADDRAEIQSDVRVLDATSPWNMKFDEPPRSATVGHPLSIPSYFPLYAGGLLGAKYVPGSEDVSVAAFAENSERVGPAEKLLAFIAASRAQPGAHANLDRTKFLSDLQDELSGFPMFQPRYPMNQKNEADRDGWNWFGNCIYSAEFAGHYSIRNLAPTGLIALTETDLREIAVAALYSFDLRGGSSAIAIGTPEQTLSSALADFTNYTLSSQAEFPPSLRTDTLRSSDVSPMAFHLALTHFIPRDQSFAVDIDPGKRLFAAVPGGYSFRTLEEKRKGRRSEVLVEMETQMANFHAPVPELQKVTYRYWLTLDAKREITGGRWESAFHPDFLWRKRDAANLFKLIPELEPYLGVR